MKTPTTHTFLSAVWLALATVACDVAPGGDDPDMSTDPDMVDTTNNDTPRTIEVKWEGGETPVELALGERFSCARYDQGGVKCWGNNQYGILGVLNTFYGTDPVPNGLDQRTEAAMVPAFGKGVKQLRAGGQFACALLDSGDVECWGFNLTRDLGTAEGTEYEAAPQRIPGVSGATRISVGGHGCAVMPDGGLICWGSDEGGQLGQGEATSTGEEFNSQRPLRVPGLDGEVVDVLAMGQYTCALLEGGRVMCMGGDLPDISSIDLTYARPFAQTVAGLHEGVTALSARGNSHMCALRNGAARCYGLNDSGQLANGSDARHELAVEVEDIDLPSAVVEIAAGTDFTCMRLEDGTVWCAGENDSGQLGDGTDRGSAFAVQVQGLMGKAVHVAAGTDHACAIIEDGTIQCWGDNRSRQLGHDDGDEARMATVVIELENPEDFGGQLPSFDVTPPSYAPPALPSPDPYLWQGGASVTQLTLGGKHACARYDQGGVRCWGEGDEGKLGYATGGDMRVPNMVPGLPAARQVVAGWRHTCALLEDGEVFCFGNNSDNQLLGGDVIDEPLPLQINGLGRGIATLFAGMSQTCALYEDTTTVKCWGGNNDAGQLGNGATGEQERPTDVMGLAGPVKQVAVGRRQSCAVLQSGEVQCWGATTFGNTVDGDTLTPVTMTELGGDVQRVVMGESHACALRTQDVVCWGKNNAGQLGQGNTDFSDAFVPLLDLPGAPVKVAVDGDMTCVEVEGGDVLCVGQNVGNIQEFRESSTSWVPVVGVEGTIQELDAGEDFLCALMEGGRVECAGRNDSGQLGDATELNTLTSVQVP